MIRLLKRAPWIALGAATAWLLDADRGAARRAQLKERLGAWNGSQPDPLVPPASVVRAEPPFEAGAPAAGGR